MSLRRQALASVGNMVKPATGEQSVFAGGRTQALRFADAERRDKESSWPSFSLDALSSKGRAQQTTSIMMNVVQENVSKGGIRAPYNPRATRRSSMRSVKGIDQDVRSATLTQLAERMAELKGVTRLAA